MGCYFSSWIGKMASRFSARFVSSIWALAAFFLQLTACLQARRADADSPNQLLPQNRRLPQSPRQAPRKNPRQDLQINHPVLRTQHPPKMPSARGGISKSSTAQASPCPTLPQSSLKNPQIHGSGPKKKLPLQKSQETSPKRTQVSPIRWHPPVPQTNCCTTVGGVITLFEEQLEWHSHVSSLTVGFAVGSMSLVSTAKKMRRL